MHRRSNIRAVVLTVLLVWLLAPLTGRCLAGTVMDVNGRPIVFTRPPQRAVSLVPTITEIIFALGAPDGLAGITYHDADLDPDNEIAVVGGFASPSLDAIAALKPDIIFISDMHLAVEERFADGDCPVVFLETDTLAESFETIRDLGRIFGKTDRAERIVTDINADLDLIADKTAKIPAADRQRVIRLMGGNRVMTPGQTSFQNEMIRAAGGLTHDFPGHSAVIPVSEKQWQAFDPQFIYGCHGDERTAAAFFNRAGWKDVSAVKNSRIHYFPCDLTCRAATHTGQFVSWLAATIYTPFFSDPDNLVRPEGPLTSVALPDPTDLPDFIKDGRIVHSRIYDFVNKTLLLEFTAPMSVLSSLEGWRDNIRTVGNHYFPPPCWPISHRLGLDKFQAHVLSVLDKNPAETAFLFTGADMDHLAVRRATFRDLTVWACVTAGVESNALRLSVDEGPYYEPGTINIILLADMPLSPRAMTRAIITATEAKTAALLDLDIRSTQHHGRYRATGTGTDNIIVIQGQGEQPLLDNAGGHSRLGQLIARAVYAGVRAAVKRQNDLTEKRDVFQRLAERDISLYSLIDPDACACSRPGNAILADLETTLLDPVYAGFVELALAVSDDHDKGVLTDLTAFNRLALDIASRLADKELTRIPAVVGRDDLPVVLETAFNALLAGIYQRYAE